MSSSCLYCRYWVTLSDTNTMLPSRLTTNRNPSRAWERGGGGGGGGGVLLDWLVYRTQLAESRWQITRMSLEQSCVFKPKVDSKVKVCDKETLAKQENMRRTTQLMPTAVCKGSVKTLLIFRVKKVHVHFREQRFLNAKLSLRVFFACIKKYFLLECSYISKF